MRISILVAFLLLVGVFVLVLVRLHPPDRLIIAAGPENGAYSAIAEQYREVLARDGITLEIVETAGSVENAGLISAGEVDVALLQGGIEVSDPGVEAIGSVFYEPMAFLVRTGAEIPRNPALWSGLRINSGQDGSGTAAAFRDLEAAVGLPSERNTHLALSYAESIAALVRGEIDIAVFVAPVDAPYLLAAYGDNRLHFMRIDYTEAISRRMVYADTVTVPAGAISLNPVLPPEPFSLIALKARLAIAPDLHPALVNRLAMAAIELHRERGIITEHQTFPSAEGVRLPVNNTARQLIVEGPSTWHDWLPYWIAAQINRVLLLLLPFVFIVLPLLQAMPGVYAFFMRWRVWQYYPELGRIEQELAERPEGAALDQLQERLEAVEERLAGMRLPVAYRQGQYDTRLHIGLIHKRIEALREEWEDARSAVSNAP
ncbi:TAXI family TRAP transporter solute-binding subunit [Lutimaribacter marinistellae]|uniref:TAXI family TRAP transporter solute-binding subunit n=1 Tax=Lutimaribacter marinistellae TaxID=1820329 RepID=A0ABV7TH66_9RHOB